MSSADIIKGQEAIKNSDYPTAIHHLTLALKNAQSPLWLIQRSTAYQRTGQHELALADADNAVIAAHSRGKRELIATAHFRRAVALHGLGRYGDARLCLLWCQKYNEKEKGVTMWQAKVKSDYDKAGGDDAECNKTTVKQMPDKVEEVAQKTPEDKKENSEPAAAKNDGGAASKAEPVVTVAEKTNTESAVPVPAATVQAPKEKIRHEWYQSHSTVTIEVFAKGVPKDITEVNIQEGSVRYPVQSCKALLRCYSSMLVFPSRHSTAHTITLLLLSSPRSINRNQASESLHTRSRLFYTNPYQA
jgi:suppressor of G2 allele of SKP1